MPQLRCLSGPCSSVHIALVQCGNAGVASTGDVEWKCEADLPDGIRFGSVTVNCEGFENSADTLVLQGSCGVEFSLLGTVAESQGFGHWLSLGLLGAVFYWIFVLNRVAPATNNNFRRG